MWYVVYRHRHRRRRFPCLPFVHFRSADAETAAVAADIVAVVVAADVRADDGDARCAAARNAISDIAADASIPAKCRRLDVPWTRRAAPRPCHRRGCARRVCKAW